MYSVSFQNTKLRTDILVIPHLTTEIGVRGKELKSPMGVVKSLAHLIVANRPRTVSVRFENFKMSVRIWSTAGTKLE